jgi:hypothetical protein
MNTLHSHPAELWSTASFGQAADTSPGELMALGEHLHLCRTSHGSLFALRCAAQAAHGFVSARLVTTIVVVVTLLLGAASLAA